MKALRVLIVDDDPLLRALTSRFLRDYENVQIIGVAETGTAGLQMVKQHRPNVVILDIQLPDGGPQTIIEQVRNLSPSTKVYLCSAYADERVEATVKQVHADGFVSKTNLKNGLADMVHAEQAESSA